MAMPAVQRRWTASEVRALIAEQPFASPRYELVEGELLVTSSPNGWHQMAVALLLVALHAYMGLERVGVELTSPSDVELEAEFITQPDVFVIPTGEWKRLNGEFPARALLLAVEVLSPSSGRHDRARKRPLYQRNVPEYWSIDLDARLIERWRTGEDRAESIVSVLEWTPEGATTPFVLDVDDYFSGIYGETD